MRVYATPADLQEWTGQVPPDNAVPLLRHASALVEENTMLAVYTVDADGLPTVPVQVEAFRDATCAQAAYWAANDIDPDKGELGETGKRVASSKSIKGASVSYDSSDLAAAKQSRIQALSTLCTTAFQILRNEGLISAVVTQ